MTGPLRVLLLCGDRGVPALGPSGSSAHLRAIARAWADRGADLVVAVPRRADDRGEHGAIAGRLVTVEPRSWRWLGPWRERGETWDGRSLADRAAADRAPSLIWERHALFVDGGARLARRLRVPRIVELNAPLSIERPGVRDRARARRVEAASLRSADRVVAVSAWLADWAIREIGCDPGRVVHVPNGSAVRPGDRGGARSRLGLDGPVAVWLGSRKPWHGLDRLPAIVDALPGWTAVVAGDGPEPIAAHPRIRAIGRVDGAALDDLLAAADVGLSTTDPAAMPWTCPLKVADYRAAGLPVAGTDAGDTRAQVGGHGAIVPADADPARWAQAIRDAAGLGRSVAPRPWAAALDEALAGAVG